MSQRLIHALPTLLVMVACSGHEVLGQVALPGQPAAPAAAGALRLVGHFPGWLERITAQADGTSVMTLLVGTMRQPMDRGDAIRLFDPATGDLLTTVEVLSDTRADVASGRVHVRVRFAEASTAVRLAALAPARASEQPSAAERDRFVRDHAPRVTIVVDFDPNAGDRIEDFVEIAASGTGTAVAADAVHPESRFTLRFREAVDLATLEQIQMLVAGDAVAQVPMRVFAVDDANTVFRFEAPLGLAFTPAMRARAIEDRELPLTRRRPHYRLSIAAGAAGLRARSGGRLDAPLELPITIDPAAADNLVAWRVWNPAKDK
jgi:hypothetical protein